MDHLSFPKIARLNRDIVITEKIDGTNAQITITEDDQFLVGSRNRWIVPGDDNYGFAFWAHEHKDELMELGVGTHFGEWWGRKIGRAYDLDHKRFSLFNTHRWNEQRPACCGVVPVLYQGPFSELKICGCEFKLISEGSVAAPGFMNPEGIVIFHTAANSYFKATLKNDEKPKSQAA